MSKKDLTYNKDQCLKARFTSAERRQIEQYVQKHNLKSCSELIRSSVLAAIQPTNNSSTEFSQQTRNNIFRDRILYVINIQPNIPKDIKTSLYQEMMKYDLM